jgi:hypothetical protein
LLIGFEAVAQTKRALLIGIDMYQPAGTSAQHPGCAYGISGADGRCALGSFPNLKGSVNDAQAMADLLASPKFGFPPGQVVLLTNPGPPKPRPGLVVLPATQTTRDGILAAMQKYLVDVPKAGDTVVFYDASHGSLRINSKGNKLTVLVNGAYVHADSTLVPADAWKGVFDVRDREMTRIFNAALDKGVHLTILLDSCHSGGATRGVGSEFRERSLPFDPRDINEAPDTLPTGQLRPAPTERSDNPALVFSAAQQTQTAKESPPPDTITEPHGAFTAALIQALQVLPADTPASIVYQRVKAVLEGSGVPDQEPDLDATPERREQPIFGGASSRPGKVSTAALGMDGDGGVWLDIGRVSGIGVGSEFLASTAASGAKPTRLRITELRGIGRSSARIISPPGATVAAGEIFELSKLIPARSTPLLVWLWPSNLSEQDVLAAVMQIKAAGVTSVSDPAEQPWTDILSYEGTGWTLQHANASVAAGSPVPLDAKRSTPVSLGPKLTADALKRRLPASARLWVNLPAPRELSAKFALRDSNSAVQMAANMDNANYLLTGVLTEDGPAYAWFHKDEFVAGPRSPITGDHSPGCSATSQYPVRSDWVTLADASDFDTGGLVLNNYISRLGKVHGWLQLANSPDGASADDFYKLALLRSDLSPVTASQILREGEQVWMALRSKGQITDSRWVYVLDINCHGKGVLMYPRGYSENQFPSDAEQGRTIILPGAGGFTIDDPYGIDTMILLSTKQPLPNPYALEFEGTTRSGQAAQSPLERLLTNASTGTRGSLEPIPTDWGIDVMALHSTPKLAAK